MSEPEIKFEIDEYGRIVYRVTNEGVLLSKDEKEFIIDHVTRMQAENAKLLELVGIMRTCIKHACLCDFCPLFVAEDMDESRCIAEMDSRMRELGVTADD